MDVRERHPGRNDTMKKKYIKPTIIDLSIEGMTGFGYGVLSAGCLTGTHFSSPTCLTGRGFNGSCSTGTLPTNTCSDGNVPSEGGTLCASGASANGRACVSGEGVSGYNSLCELGSDREITLDCDGGSTATYCSNGNSNVGPFS